MADWCKRIRALPCRGLLESEVLIRRYVGCFACGVGVVGLDRKLPFLCVYVLWCCGVIVCVGWVSLDVPGNCMLRGLVCVIMCVGAGRNLVSISLGFSVVLTPLICTFPSK